MSDEEQDDLSVAELAAKYLEIRDLKDRLRKKYEAADAVLDEQFDAISSRLMALCNEQDASSIRTIYGTVIRSLKVRYDPKDWEAMHEFVLEHRAPYLLQKRVNEGAMKEFLEANPDDFPKGMNIVSEYKITVRKPTKK